MPKCLKFKSLLNTRKASSWLTETKNVVGNLRGPILTLWYTYLLNQLAVNLFHESIIVLGELPNSTPTISTFSANENVSLPNSFFPYPIPDNTAEASDIFQAKDVDDGSVRVKESFLPQWNFDRTMIPLSIMYIILFPKGSNKNSLETQWLKW